MTIKYLDGADPLYIKGSKKGCLLLHGGGGGTAWDLKEFSKELYSTTGMTIWLPALKGFGTKPEDLYNIKFSDWMTDTRNALKKLHQDCESVFVVGHSLGGLLTLLLAAENEKINGIVTWAAPFGVQASFHTFLPIIGKIPILRNHLLTLIPIFIKLPILNRLIPKKIPSSAPNTAKKKGWVGYEWIPPSIGIGLQEGLKRLKKSIHEVKCPAFIIQGTEDEMVSNDSSNKIYHQISSSKKELWIVDGAGHAIMNDDNYKDELFARTIKFIESLSLSTLEPLK
ncbi:MAG: alpha/beta hydrolase [Candidatus Hodarchaeota archaeon]